MSQDSQEKWKLRDTTFIYKNSKHFLFFGLTPNFEHSFSKNPKFGLIPISKSEKSEKSEIKYEEFKNLRFQRKSHFNFPYISSNPV